MVTRTFPQPLQQRFRWAIRESILIAGIFLFWIGVGLLLVSLLGAFVFVAQVVNVGPSRFLYELSRQSGVMWAAVTQLASATTGLYVLVRAGTILIDRYQSDPGE
ncbi:hypothetical protein ACFOZ7_00605 [Natribaculum luteum]|uniref:Uncharacterized protein n=1 Tax=Natribaculum luteum TaxID=1586232 RepID=A0ABD5NU82_9EURY|nr:hypothetical protein [Natribaculum luteum]